jgi:hypothetical protein
MFKPRGNCKEFIGKADVNAQDAYNEPRDANLACCTGYRKEKRRKEKTKI